MQRSPADPSGVAPPAFDAEAVRRYYDRHTATFVTFGRGGTVGAIHRALWGPGVRTREQAFHYVDDRIADLIRSMPAGAGPPHVVDLGCGVGATLGYLAARLPLRGTGVTLSPVQAALARERLRACGVSDRVECREASYDALPPSIPPADLAYAIESFAHAPAPARFFAECARLVRVGGVLAICDDVRRPTSDPRAPRAIARFVRGWRLNAVLLPSEIDALAQAAGFVREATLDLTPYVEPRTMGDRVLDTLLGWLPLGATPLGPVLGGTALKTCQERGWLGYELAVFRRREDDVPAGS